MPLPYSRKQFAPVKRAGLVDRELARLDGPPTDPRDAHQAAPRRFKNRRVVNGRSAAVRLKRDLTAAGAGGRVLSADSAGRTSKSWSSVAVERVTLILRTETDRDRASFRRALRACGVNADSRADRRIRRCLDYCARLQRSGRQLAPYQLARVGLILRAAPDPFPIWTAGAPENGYARSAAFVVWGDRPSLDRLCATVRSLWIEPPVFGGDTHVLAGSGAGSAVNWRRMIRQPADYSGARVTKPVRPQSDVRQHNDRETALDGLRGLNWDGSGI